MHHRKMPAGRASLHRRQHHAIDRLMPFTGAPLFHALQLLATSDSARFHMPGHKGQPVFNSFRDVFAIDYTETYGTGNLYLGDGPIRDAEVAAARYFGANDCFFLTGGSTQGILAMLGTEGDKTDYAAHLFGLLSGFIVGGAAGWISRLTAPSPIINALLGLSAAGLVVLCWKLAL